MRIFYRIFLTSIILIFVAVTAALISIMEKPRSIPLITYYIEKSLNDEAFPFKITVKDTIIQWNKNQKFITFEAYNTVITDKISHIQLAELPNISIKLNWRKLLLGNIIPKHVEIKSPKFIYKVKNEKQVNIDFVKLVNDSYLTMVKLPLRTITLNDASIYLYAKKDVYWKIKHANLHVIKDKDYYNINSKAQFDLNGEESSLELNVKAPKNSSETSLIDYELYFNDVPTHIGNIFEHQFNDLLENNKFVLTGNFKASLTNDAKLQLAKFELVDVYGNIKLENKIFIDNLSANGNISGGGDLINIENSEIKLANGSKITNSAILKHWDELLVTTKLNNFPVKDIGNFWPKNSAIDAREWVVDRIKGGMIENAKGKFNLKKDYLLKDKLPSDAIDAVISFKDSSIKYYDDLPPVEHINGNAYFTSNAINIKVDKAKSLNSNISKAIVNVPYFDINDKYVEVSCQVEGGINDIISFIPEDTIKEAKKGSVNLREITGHALTDVNIKVPYVETLDFDDIEFLIKTNLNNVYLEKLPNNTTLSNGQLEVIFNGSKVQVEGEAKLSNNPSSLKWINHIDDNAKYDFEFDLATTLLPENISSFKLMNEQAFKKGVIKVNSSLVGKDGVNRLDAKIDLKDANIVIEKVGFNKDIGTQANAEIKAVINDSDKDIKVTDFKLTGNNILINGTANISKALLTIKQAKLNKIKYASNDLIIDYQTTLKGFKSTITGTMVDLRNAKILKLFENSNVKPEDEQITVNIKTALMKNNQIFRNLIGNINCYENNGCNNINVNAVIGDKAQLRILMQPKGNNSSELIIDTTDAAALFNGLDIYKNIKGGNLVLTAKKTTTKTSDKLNSSVKGEIIVNNFSALKTPVLSKLLTISSVPGLIGLLNGRAIPFEKFHSYFSTNDNVITLTKGRVEGTQLGLTIEGVINGGNQTINLNGAIIPDLYFLNKVIGSIPVLGDLLQGGKNEGIIAANYSIKGNFDKVDTFVNPLSVLTPGFLRNIFSIFKTNNAKVQPAK